MACRESSIDFLRDLGYTAIRLPRERIHPLDLIGRLPAGRTKQLGSLVKLVVGREAPEVWRDEPVAEVTGKKTDKLDLGIGLSLLSSFFTALGAGSGKLKSTFGKTRSVEFFYEDVQSDSVDIVDLTGYLGERPSLNYTNPVLRQYFMGDGEVVVITRTLKSNSFGIVASDESGHALDLDVSPLKKELARVGVKAVKGSESKVSFKGTRKYVFAFQGLLLRINSGGLAISDEISPEMGAFAYTETKPGTARPVLLTRSGLLSLD